MEKIRAKNNRTLTVSGEERALYSSRLFRDKAGTGKFSPEQILDRTICADLFSVLKRLPENFADLLIIDPPYNLSKKFGSLSFSATDDEKYSAYLESWFPALLPVLKDGGSVYLCGDWKNSVPLYQILKKHLAVRNRIIWQREKGRGAARNWKNSCEDIWFATKGEGYYFDLDAVKLKRSVLAPYRENGRPKDWNESGGEKYRLTCPGNFWDDISVPFWSMPENTDHPTQKPEKLMAKLLLASCPPGGTVLDPFLGSGSTSVAAKKLGRHFCGIEMNEEYCVWAEKRLALAEKDKSIQGYENGIFYERNAKFRGGSAL